ncbi:MAG: hypothetical protein WCA64_04765, partial [Gallionella sp.]
MSSAFYKKIAEYILSCPAQQLPDLRGATVLLPNYHVAGPLARALGEVSQSTLLLPKMVTLGDWAQDVVLDMPVIADSQRGALLYRQLRRQRWFGQADLWLMTRELLALFDELTHSLTVLPDNPEAFAAAVGQAYQARQNSALQLEARLVFELWYAMQADSEPDAARAYQLRLAKLAAQAERPLYVLRTSDWNALEQRFLDEYATRAAVTVFDLRVLRENAETSLRAQIIRAAMSADDAHDLRTMAAQWQGTPPPGDTLRFFAATSLEQEARAAAMQVRR